MMSKNLVDNLPVFVEFNPTYKLLFVSCLLDQKKNFFTKNDTYVGWIKITERNGIKQLFWIIRKKEVKERKRKILRLCYLEIFQIAVDLKLVERRY